ncbi:MAG: acetyl-CoA carboxylase biotin carboxyl carrier protein [Planctomycetes bacterium]|nr:acetyl-CoA carboxylase biotin carboxyl carrier protein [Planctomycetota bacterium]
MDMEEIKRLIELMNENELLEVELVEEGKKIRLKKKFEGAAKVIPMQAAMPVAPVAAAPAVEAAAPSTEGLLEIKSPMVGTFYSAANPESPPYCEEGDAVSADTSVCIVEAMKVFNEIKAEVEGTIASILVKSGDTVEYGQIMFLVKPN